MSSARDKYADLITESYEIKKLVREALNSNGIKLYALCKREGLVYERIKFWLNIRNAKEVRGVVAQSDVMKLAKSLGITIRITVTINKNHEAGDDVKHAAKRAIAAQKNSVHTMIKEHERQRRIKRREDQGSAPGAEGVD